MKNHVLLTVAFILAVLSKEGYAIDEGWLPHALEAYDLGSLRVCATVLDEDVPYAIIKDPNGYTHRAFIRDKMGKNFGRVREINKGGLKIEELVEIKEGEWVSRNVVLKYKKDEEECPILMPEIKCKKPSIRAKQNPSR